MLCMLSIPVFVFVTDVMLFEPADTFIPMGAAAHKVISCFVLLHSTSYFGCAAMLCTKTAILRSLRQLMTMNSLRYHKALTC